jgi:hypothetical protein
MRRCLLFSVIGTAVLVLVTSFCVIPTAYAVPPTPAKTPSPSNTIGNPLFVLVEYDPWRSVIGSDSPTIALYDNGLVIFVRQNSQGKPEYVSAMLSSDEFAKLRTSLAGNDEFFALKEYYDLLLPTDQPSNVITLWDAKRGAKRVGVYGDLRYSREARDLAPLPFVQLYDVAIGYAHPKAASWLPEKFEVIIWEYQTSDAIPWPKGWPDLNDRATVKRAEVYSLYLEASKLSTFRTLTKNGNALLINGKTRAFSLRFPLPREELWQKLKIGS